MLKLSAEIPLDQLRFEGANEDQIEKLILTVFNASLHSVEAEYHPVRLCAVESAKPGETIAKLRTPILATVKEVAKLASGLSSGGLWLAAWPAREGHFRIWGVLREAVGKHLFVTAPRPGVLTVKSGRTEELSFIHGERAPRPHRILSSNGILLQLLAQRAQRIEDCDQFVSCYLDAVRTIVQALVGGHGGTLVLLPKEEEFDQAPLDAKQYRVAEVEGPSPLVEWVRKTAKARKSYNRACEPAMRRAFEGPLPAPGEILHRKFEVPLDEIRAEDEAKSRWLAFTKELRKLASGIGSLGGIDGAIVLSHDLHLLSFGTFLNAGTEAVQIRRAQDAAGTELEEATLPAHGTRHVSAAQFCKRTPCAIVFVASQDGQVSCFLSYQEDLVQWKPVDLDSISQTPLTHLGLGPR